LIISKLLKKVDKKPTELGNYLFILGIFFLGTAPFISLIFLLPSLIIGSFAREENYFSDRWNYPFFIASILMVLSSTIHYFQATFSTIEYDHKLSYIGLFNWIPLFWCFWGFQPYLSTRESRRNFLLVVLAGSFPILINGFLQFFFNFYGPFESLNGLITWFQRPIDNNTQGLTSIFNNQNYAGSWLSMIFFFSLAFALVRKEKKLKKSFSFLFTIFIGLATFLTYSRNAILSVLIFSLTFFDTRKIKIIVFLTLIILIYFIYSYDLTYSTNFDPNTFKEKTDFLTINIKKFGNFLHTVFPDGIYNKINKSFISEGLELSPRIIIWTSAIKFISQKSLFGWGAGSYSYLFEANNLGSFNPQHTHNLPLEIALSYGIPASLIIIFSLLFLTYKNFKLELYYLRNNSYLKGNLFDKALKTSAAIFLFSQFFDITYFDSRINVLSWIIFSSMRNILREKVN